MTDARTAGRTAPDARLRDLPRDASALPSLPPEFEATLDAGLAALGLRLSAAGRAAIDAHVRMLLAWNEAINLTAITDPAAVAARHVLDSLAAAPLLAGRPLVIGPPLAIVDLGSGGGFPGLPLAAALPTARVTLVDSVGKKGRFLEAAINATGLADRVHVRVARAEAIAPRTAVPSSRGWDVVTARAVAALPDLVELGLPLVRVGGRLVAWKRGEISAELEAAGRAAATLGGGPPAVHPIDGIPELSGHVLVTVPKRATTPGGFPRDPARRSRQPW